MGRERAGEAPGRALGRRPRPWCLLSGRRHHPSAGSGDGASPGNPPSPPPPPPPPRAVGGGEPIFSEKCAPCHGATGGGDGPQAGDLPNPPVAFTDPEVAQKGIPEEWFRVVTEGRFDRFMPGFTSLDDGERWDVVGYALSLGLSQTMVDVGRIVYQEHCARRPGH